jgi:hypothetical protein
VADERRHILVLPERDAAEEVAEEVAERLGNSVAPPQVVREALAGEDDAEDAQWLVVIEAYGERPRSRCAPADLDALAADYEGWLERD